MKPLFPLFLCVFMSFPVQALPTAEARSAAIFILQQRPAVRALFVSGATQFPVGANLAEH